MTEKKYIPKDEKGLLDWLNNFSSQISSIGTTFGITPSEISSLLVLIDSVENDLRRGYGQEMDKIEKRAGMLKFVDKYVNRIVIHSAYNASDHGKRLKIIE
jgi:hypothetical protein